MLKNLLLFIILASFSFAATCEPGFRDEVRVQIFDAKWRPIQNATVTFTYQKDQTTGKGYITTAPLYTDSQGKVATFLQNTEQLASRVRCDIRINVTFDGVTKTRTITAQHHLADEQFQFDAYSLILKAVDKYGRALPDVPVRVNQMEKTADSSGFAYFTVNKNNNVEVAVIYRGAVLTKTIEVQNDTFYTIQALLYNLILTVVDDSSNPLDVEIQVDSEAYYGSNLTIEDTPLARPSVHVTYGTLTKVPEIDLSQRESYTIVFDLMPPEISDVQVEMTEEGNMELTFRVTDPNPLASGPSLEDTTVAYNIAGTTYTAIPYVEGGRYVAEIIQPPENSLIRFTIVAKDKEGNMETLEGEYLVQPSAPEEPVTPPEEPEEPEPGIVPSENILFLIAAAVVGLVLLWVVYNYIRGLAS